MAHIYISIQQLTLLLILITYQLKDLHCREFHVTRSFYIRHYFGKCLIYDETRQTLLFHPVCKDKFKWHGGVRLIHLPTRKCVDVNATNDGSFLSLTDQCDVKSTIFQYVEKERMIKHLMSGKCLHPDGNEVDPSNNNAVIIKSGCNHDTNRYYFRKIAYYIIRHFGGYCWVYSSSDNLIKLSNPIACDRFEYQNDNHLRHVDSGKCVFFSDGYLRLTKDCTSLQTIYWANALSQIQSDAKKCLQPHNGHLNPPDGNLIVLSDCKNDNFQKFSFYDEKDIIRIKVISESCLDITPGTSCYSAKGHMIVNGRQTSLNQRGVNAVLFDYRSGLYEDRSTYDVYGSNTAKNNLVSFINGLAPGKILILSAKDAVYFDTNSANALQNIGVSATFATPNLPKIQVSLAFIRYTGPERKFWERSVNKVGGSGASVVEVVIPTFVDRDGSADCSYELGVRTGKIPDSSFYARTTWHNEYSHKPFKSRLHLHGPGWCSAASAPLSDYLQVDLGTIKLVSGVALQSHGTYYSHYVTKFKLQYSTDGNNWKFLKDDANVEKELKGLKASLIETKVNWFQNTFVRVLRIVPTGRVSTHGTTCIRFELFGCQSQETLVLSSESKRKFVNEIFKESISVFSLSNSKFKFSTSIAADEKTLATSIEQTHLLKLNASVTFDNGTLLQEYGKTKKIRNLANGIEYACFIEFDFEKEDYHAIEIESLQRVLDAKLHTGIRQSVMTIEENEELIIVSLPNQFERKSPDRSILEFNVTSNIPDQLVDGKHFHLNMSLSHMFAQTKESHANAYATRMIIYYEKDFLEFKSIKFVNENGFSLHPSTNRTKLGLVEIMTNTFYLVNSQKLQLELMFKNKHEILAAKCQGEIIVDFAYKNNVQMFNGTLVSSLCKLLPYKCSFEPSIPITTTATARFPLHTLSIVYDDANQDFFFCYQKKTQIRRNAPLCYLQAKESNEWISVGHFSSIVGIDKSKRTLYGVDKVGASYVQSVYPFTEVVYIEDSEWTNVQNKDETNKALTSSKLDLLPSTVDPSWVLSDGEQRWAATSTGILKKIDGAWKHVVSWM